MEMSIDFAGFWDLATPADVARIIAELYGEDATKAAEQCMASASADHRYEDYCFWQRVLNRIVDAGQQRETVPQ